MKRFFIGMFITIGWMLAELLMIVNYDSQILSLLPVLFLGISLSSLWEVGVRSNVKLVEKELNDVNRDK